MMMNINSFYVTAKDFDRAKTWYSQILFERSPDTETDRFAFWNVNGFLFGIFNPKVTGETITFGNNCVLNIEHPKLKKFYATLQAKNISITMKFQTVNNTNIFQCKDSEGNILEFYEWNNR